MRHWLETVPSDRLAHLVKDAMRGLSRALQMRLTEHGVSFGHWTFLRILWDQDGLTQRELSERAGLQEPTTYAALTAMERMGHVSRARDPANRRKVQVFLTPQGRALRDKLVPLAEQVNQVAVNGVSAEDVAATRRTLLAIIRNLAEDEAAAPRERRFPSTRALSRLLVQVGSE